MVGKKNRRQQKLTINLIWQMTSLSIPLEIRFLVDDTFNLASKFEDLTLIKVGTNCLTDELLRKSFTPTKIVQYKGAPTYIQVTVGFLSWYSSFSWRSDCRIFKC